TIGRVRCRDAGPAQWQRVLDEAAAAELAPASVDGILRFIRQLVGLGKERRVWSANAKPLAGVDLPEPFEVTPLGPVAQEHVPTAGQVAALEEALTAMRPYYGLMAAVAARCGLRWGELVELRTDDVDLEQHVIQVSRQWRETDGVVTLPK